MKIKRSSFVVRMAMNLRNNERSLWPSTEIELQIKIHH